MHSNSSHVFLFVFYNLSMTLKSSWTGRPAPIFSEVNPGVIISTNAHMHMLFLSRQLSTILVDLTNPYCAFPVKISHCCNPSVLSLSDGYRDQQISSLTDVNEKMKHWKIVLKCIMKCIVICSNVFHAGWNYEQSLKKKPFKNQMLFLYFIGPSTFSIISPLFSAQWQFF